VNPDDIINAYKEKLGGEPSIGTVEEERDETLKKASHAQVLARLLERIVVAYQILADVSCGRRNVSTSKVALLVSGLAYITLPLDFVCDAIPVAGLLDDGIVLTWIFSQCADLFKNDEPPESPKQEREK
jgi:uncharacterized membrane protein YkvA (DUF1232 family)